MIRNLRMRCADERGIAVITAMLVSMVVVFLGVTSVRIAIHNSEASSFDRRRVQGVAAAEAGLNYYYSHLQSVPAAEFDCDVSQTLTASPTTQFSATVRFYDAAGAEIPTCPPATTPAGALIRSTGTSVNAAEPNRTLESYVNLIPLSGGPFGEYAIFSDGSPGFDSNIQVFGDGTTNGDVYTNSNVLMNSNSVIHGSMFTRGTMEMDSNAEVKADVVAMNSLTMKSNSRVLGNATSSTSSIWMDSEAHIFGNARAGTTITTLGGSEINGSRTPNSPLSPAQPEHQAFPVYTFSASDWTAQGYTVLTFSDCGAATKAAIGTVPVGGKRVVRITSACELKYAGDEVIGIAGDLAIVSNGSFLMDSNAKFLNVGVPHTLHLMFGVGSSPPSCSQNITFKSNTKIEGGLTTLLYTPCTLDMSSNSFVAQGQMFAGRVDFNSNSTLTYKPVNVPGVGDGLFDEDIVYIREVVS
jgi:cytoskeletal protein CcmA (bactofilin family)